MEKIDREALRARQERIHWIMDGSVCVIDGWCWALTPRLRTVCIGKEADVLKGKENE